MVLKNIPQLQGCCTPNYGPKSKKVWKALVDLRDFSGPEQKENHQQNKVSDHKKYFLQLVQMKTI